MCKANAFVQELYCWCIQGHADIKKMSLRAAVKAPNLGAEKWHSEARERADK